MFTEAHYRNNLNFLQGCYSPEIESGGPFVWAPSRFDLTLPQPARFVRLQLAYLGEQGTLRLVDADCSVEACLRRGWQDCLLQVPASLARLRLQVGPVARVDGDDRELGVMIRKISFLDDDEKLARLRSVAENALLNDIEFRKGEFRLASFPPYLRINSEVRCNLPETTQACAYCAWDHAKAAEQGAPPFTLDTLNDLGRFYSDAHSVGDCSIGEPLMNRHFAATASRLDAEEKHFSFTTNGELLVERRRQEILGKNIDLYVSIDAATAEGYKRYRNDRFDRIIGNLRSLCAEKRKRGDLPRVIAAFIAMRSNLDELERYIRLMKDIGVDLIKLRALYEGIRATTVVVNNGYRFDYAAETLSRDELAAVGERARRLSEQIEIPLYVEWDQFEPEAHGNSGQPLCAEPWKTMYPLARGIFPCCYGTEPLAKWQDQGDRPLDQFLQDVFNSPDYQHLRRELAAGRLASYCEKSPSCPVIKRLTS